MSLSSAAIQAASCANRLLPRRRSCRANRWNLTNVIVYYRENLPASRLDRLVYSGAMKPAAAGARSGDPEEMTISDLNYFIANSGFGIRPVWVYETWWQKRISLFFATLVMIAICIPIATRFRRGGGLGMLFATGCGAWLSLFRGRWPVAHHGGTGICKPLDGGVDARFELWRLGYGPEPSH